MKLLEDIARGQHANFDEIEGLLEHRFEALFNGPAAEASDWAGSIIWRSIVITKWNIDAHWIVRSESQEAFKVLNLLSNQGDVFARHEVPLDSNLSNALIVVSFTKEVHRIRINHISNPFDLTV